MMLGSVISIEASNDVIIKQINTTDFIWLKPGFNSYNG